MSYPLVSVLVPTYRQAQFVAEAVTSALSQDYPSLEVLVGDDCSPDGTPEAVARVDDVRLRYFRHATNIGRISNYRALLAEAKGEFVVNLDGDDYFTDPGFIQKAVLALSADPSVVLAVANARKGAGGRTRLSRLPTAGSMHGLEVLRKLPSRRFFFMHLGCVYRRRQAVELDFYRFPGLSSDYESLYRLSALGTVAFLDSVAGVWRIHGENETATSELAPLLQNLEVWRNVFSFAVDYGFPARLAHRQEARCVAAFIATNCATIGRTAPSLVATFLRLAWQRDVRPFIYVLFSPFNFFRVLLAVVRQALSLVRNLLS